MAVSEGETEEEEEASTVRVAVREAEADVDVVAAGVPTGVPLLLLEGVRVLVGLLLPVGETPKDSEGVADDVGGAVPGTEGVVVGVNSCSVALRAATQSAWPEHSVVQLVCP